MAAQVTKTRAAAVVGEGQSLQVLFRLDPFVEEAVLEKDQDCST